MRKGIALLIMVPVMAAGTDEPHGEPSRHVEFAVDEGTWMSVDVDPSGQSIVFDLLGDLYIMPATGGNATRIRGGTAFDAQPVYSPDGQAIAFVSDESGAENVWVANADGTNARMVSEASDASRYSSPAWASNGESIYVSRRQGRYGSFELRQYYLTGGSGAAVAGGDESERLGAVASHDGRYLYMASKSGSSATRYISPEWHIARLDFATGKSQQVATAPKGFSSPPSDPAAGSLLTACDWMAKQVFASATWNRAMTVGSHTRCRGITPMARLIAIFCQIMRSHRTAKGLWRQSAEKFSISKSRVATKPCCRFRQKFRSNSGRLRSTMLPWTVGRSERG